MDTVSVETLPPPARRVFGFCLIATIITSLAMWSADKVKFQNELAERIAKLVHIIGQFGSDGFSAWLSAALFIIDNEWNKIDYWRMNKFLKLVKFVLKESI